MLYEFDDLNKLIDEKSRERFIKKIFDGSTDEYLRFITSIQHIENWKEAYQFMDMEFSRRNININNHRDAVCLTDIVFKKYFPLYQF